MYCIALFSFMSWTSAQDIPSRYRVAVLNFAVTDVRDGSLEPQSALGEAMSASFDAPLVQAQRFTVVARTDIEQVLDELNLQNTGIISAEEAQKIGAISGAEIVVTGVVVVNNDESYTITSRFIDVATAQIRAAYTAEAENTRAFPQVASGFVQRALVTFPTQGQVIAVEGDEVFINIGTETGLLPGDEGGSITRVRDIAGTPFPEAIGSFRIVQAGPQASKIKVEALEPNKSVAVNDLVTIDSPDISAVTQNALVPPTQTTAEPATTESTTETATTQPTEPVTDGSTGGATGREPATAVQPVAAIPVSPPSAKCDASDTAMLVCGQYANLTMDDARALLDTYEAARNEAGTPIFFTQEQRNMIFANVKREFPKATREEQVVVADMRRIYEEVNTYWLSYSLEKKLYFLLGLSFLLEEGHEAALMAQQMGVACDNFSCFYQEGYWTWGP